MDNSFAILQTFIRHCEEQSDEAIQRPPVRLLDCFATLAKTRRLARLAELYFERQSFSKIPADGNAESGLVKPA